MASIRDLLVGALVSGAVTFGTTFYFGEREHQRRLEERNLALAQAQEQLEQQQRQTHTASLYERWTGPEMAESRAVLDRALRQRTDSILEWETSAVASNADTAAMREVLRFYGELGIQLRANQLDPNLIRGLFGPNVEWWNQRALPTLCQGYSSNGADDRFNNALLTLEEISGRAAQGCPSFANPVGQIRPMPAPNLRPMPAPMSAPG